MRDDTYTQPPGNANASGRNLAGAIGGVGPASPTILSPGTATPKPAPMTDEWFDEVFTYHRPDDLSQAAYLAIREAGKVFAKTIAAHTPRCADQTAAVRLVREAVAIANAAVALKGLI